jgi:acyl-CoA oxidase
MDVNPVAGELNQSGLVGTTASDRSASLDDLTARLNTLAITDLWQHDANSLDRESLIREVYRIYEIVGGTAALDCASITEDLAPLLATMESQCLPLHGGICPLLASHYNLFLGTVLELGDLSEPAIAALVEDAVARRTHGIYMVTEIACGNNAMSMGTEARYDPATDTFELHTPSPDAAKIMPYLAFEGVSKTAVVMARLKVGDRDHGVHPFVVPCRDHAGQLYPGIRVSNPGVLDLPYYGAVDHAITTFDRVRLPRWAMLSGDENQLSRDGEFRTTLANSREIFFNSLRRVDWGKFVLTASIMPGLKLSLVLATHYALTRALNSHSGRRVPLADNAFHRRSLARAYVRGHGAIALYEGLKQKHLPNGRREPARFKTDAGLVKAISVELAREVVGECMKRCGAQGKFMRNRISTTLALCDAVATAEGDSVPVMMMVAKDVLCWPDSELDDGTPLGALAIQIRNEMTRDLLAATDKMAMWNDLGEQARQLAWVTGLITATRFLDERPDVQQAFVNAAILELVPELLQYGTIDAAEIAVLQTKHPLELDAIWSRYASTMPSEFAMAELMATTPLGSPDLAAAWFSLAPELTAEA